ncbi:MAG: hypothetical protein RIC19_12595 [Phaeodactylibacter sp.]|uniref:hypothetical protein n=1 Tax=Phaeodactylibacter sp. TaxID=1940289 RepID=UPI0032F08D71
MRTRSSFPPILFLVLSLTSCMSPEKLVEKGNYEAAIEVASRRLAGKKNKKAKYVLALEEAFAKANQRDLSNADRLKRQGRPENWARIHEHYLSIRKRQEAVAPLLPLVSKEGIKANFRFVKVDELETESREKAAEFHYAEAIRLLRNARQTGDRLEARQAFAELDRIGQYFKRYRDVEQLQEEALYLGTTFVLVRLRQEAPVTMPNAFEQELTAIAVQDLNSQWKVYHTRPVKGQEYDYEVVMRINRIEVSPGLVREREYEETAVVEDGWEYVLDQNGNVAKDTLGNDIKVPREVRVRALVLENYQNKTVRVNGRLEFLDRATENIIHTEPLFAEAIFENYAATFRGDKRALSKQSRQRIGNQPVPFPSEEVLLLQAVEQLKPFIKREIARTRRMI